MPGSCRASPQTTRFQYKPMARPSRNDVIWGGGLATGPPFLLYLLPETAPGLELGPLFSPSAAPGMAQTGCTFRGGRLCPARGQVVTLPGAGSTGGPATAGATVPGVGGLLSCSRTGASRSVGYALLFCECIHIIQLKGNLDEEFANVILALLRSNASVAVRRFGTTWCHCHSSSS